MPYIPSLMKIFPMHIYNSICIIYVMATSEIQSSFKYMSSNGRLLSILIFTFIRRDACVYYQLVIVYIRIQLVWVQWWNVNEYTRYITYVQSVLESNITTSSTFVQLLSFSTILRYLYFYFLLLYTSTPLHLRGKYCTFYSSTFL